MHLRRTLPGHHGGDPFPPVIPRESNVILIIPITLAMTFTVLYVEASPSHHVACAIAASIGLIIMMPS